MTSLLIPGVLPVLKFPLIRPNRKYHGGEVMKNQLTREQADKLWKEVYEYSIKNGFPIIEKKPKKNKKTTSK